MKVKFFSRGYCCVHFIPAIFRLIAAPLNFAARELNDRANKKLIFSGFFLLLACQIGSVPVLSREVPGTIIISNVTVIDGTGKHAQPQMRVFVKDGRIESVEPAGANAKNPAGARLIDGTGKFLIPGLWDTHIHLGDVGEEAIPILPVYGITSVRDMGGDIPELKKWRAEIESGKLIGPRIKFCGPMLEGKWDSAATGRTDHWVVANPEQAREIVNKLAGEGVDCIKMRSYASPETYFALAAAAKANNLPLVGHAPFEIDPIKASGAGQRSYEHGFYPWPWDTLPAEKKKEIEDTFRKNGTVIVPTLIAWETRRFTFDVISAVMKDYASKSDPRLKTVSPTLRKNWLSDLKDLKGMNTGSPGWNKALDSHFEQVAELHENGIIMMAGTDTGAPMVYPGAGLHQEIKLLVRKCRFTPMDAILSATIIPAKFFGMENELGTIEKGKLADMVLLSADPLQDIENIRMIDSVIVRGNLLDRAALDKIKSEVEKKIAAEYKSNGNN